MTDTTPVMLTDPPPGYADWLSDLKNRIHSAQQRAALAVNRELVLLYWQIGRDILARQAEQGKLKTREERDWYLSQAVEHNWPRNVLVMQIERELEGL